MTQASPLATHAASPAELKERLDAQRQGLPFLVYRDGAGIQRILPLGAGTDRVSIGRRPESELQLGWDSEVSRLHAMLERVGGEWTVVDDGLSANGTFLGADRLSGRRRLLDGDVVRVGRTSIAFCDPAAASGGATSKGDSLSEIRRLSEAQRRVLVALCRPFRDGSAYAAPATNQQIAEELYLSIDAVKTHLRVLFGKFGIEQLPQNQKRLQLVELALRGGIVTERELRD
jgi:pSer/pThr/pTyr-binding forkhead associated (FHA) protein